MQLLEHRREQHAFELGVQREHVAGGAGSRRQREQMRRDVVFGDAFGADQLVERRQRRRKLRAADQLGVPDRQVRMRAAPVRAVVEAEALRQPQRVHVHLPAGGAVRARRLLEDIGVALACPDHLASRPLGVGVRHAVLPADVVPAMDAGLVARCRAPRA